MLQPMVLLEISSRSSPCPGEQPRVHLGWDLSLLGPRNPLHPILNPASISYIP